MYLDYTTEPQIPSRIYENGNFIIVMGNSAETTTIRFDLIKRQIQYDIGWLGSRVVSMLDSGAEGPRFKSQSRRCRVTVLDKLFTPIVPLFTKQ